MAETQKKKHSTKPKSNCFSGCFGFCGTEETLPEKNPMETNIQSNTQKQSRWFSRSRKSATQTVPFADVATEKAAVNSKSHKSKPKLMKWKSDSKPSSNSNSNSNHQSPIPNPKLPRKITTDKEVAPDDQAARETPPATRKEPEKNIIFENGRKSSDHGGSAKDDMAKNKRLPFCRRIESMRTGSSSSQPGSPEVMAKPKTNSELSHSVSLPVPKSDKRAGNSTAHSRVVLKEVREENCEGDGRKFDPTVGLSIIIVTLIIMLIWGRLCAILCTSTWFYFCPRLRAARNKDGVAKSNEKFEDLDLNSEEYKKKVVLEGLLERRKRRGTF